MTEQKEIRISGVLEDLNNGMNRLQIGEKYSITPREVKSLFEHPKLKGKKAKKKVVDTFKIVDDTDEEVQAQDTQGDDAPGAE